MFSLRNKIVGLKLKHRPPGCEPREKPRPLEEAARKAIHRAGVIAL
jgi:hypothetical protein